MLLEGKADLIAGGFTDTIERRKKIDFTVEVFPTRAVVVTRKPHAPVTSLEQLRAMRVITHRGTSMVESLVAAGVPLASISYVGKGTVEDALEERQADAGVLGLEVAILARRANPELELGLFLGEPGSLAYGLRKGDTELRQALDTYLANRRRTATWGRLVVKYFGENALEILKAARKPSS
jgi:lysine/arginine/ornithine transport system substrate-binding protein